MFHAFALTHVENPSGKITRPANFCRVRRSCLGSRSSLGTLSSSLIIPQKMLSIRQEMPPDIAAIHRVNAAAFGQSAEADLVDRLWTSGALTCTESSTTVIRKIVSGGQTFLTTIFTEVRSSRHQRHGKRARPGSMSTSRVSAFPMP